MHARLEELGCADILALTWSCWYPQADGSACAHCLMCRHRYVPQQKVSEGAPPVGKRNYAAPAEGPAHPAVPQRAPAPPKVRASAVREEVEESPELGGRTGCSFDGGDPFGDLCLSD
jgi:hypothetical protein